MNVSNNALWTIFYWTIITFIDKPFFRRQVISTHDIHRSPKHLCADIASLRDDNINGISMG